jgi:hypothetical protein
VCHKTGRIYLPLIAASLAACADTTITPPPDVVFALFDPAGTPPELPLPNDIAMFSGHPDSVTVTSFSAALDPASVRFDDVIAIDLVMMSPIVGIGPSLDSGMAQLSIMPPATGWPLGRVAIVLRGGDTGLRGAGGQPVVATPTFYFARSPSPISNCTSALDCTSATPVLTTEQAVALEGLRQAYAPLLAAVEARGLSRNDIVLVWTFTVTS